MNRCFLAGAIALLVAGAVHCAAIMGVEEATLRDEAGSSAPEAGESGTVPIGEAGPEECIGEGCPCAGASDCKHPAFPRCVAGLCMECSTELDGGCDTVEYCLAGSPDAAPDSGIKRFNQCVPGCTSDDACKAISQAAPFCVVERHHCVACRSKADCPNLNEDCSLAGVCSTKCDAGTCPGTGDICCDGLCVDPKTDIFNCNGCGNVCSGSAVVCCDGQCKNGGPKCDP